MYRLIWTQDLDGIIGDGHDMPWHLPEDLKYFADTTMGQPVIMGRTTWDSIPQKFRPLPGRDNLVLSRSLHTLPGATVFSSLDDALAHTAPTGAWIIGGASPYRQALDHPLVTEAYVTYVDTHLQEHIPTPVTVSLGDGWVETHTTDWIRSTGTIRATGEHPRIRFARYRRE